MLKNYGPGRNGLTVFGSFVKCFRMICIERLKLSENPNDVEILRFSTTLFASYFTFST
jgi:hypothetical protein